MRAAVPDRLHGLFFAGPSTHVRLKRLPGSPTTRPPVKGGATHGPISQWSLMPHPEPGSPHLQITEVSLPMVRLLIPVQGDTARLDLLTSHPVLIFWTTANIQITGADDKRGNQRSPHHRGRSNLLRKFCPFYVMQRVVFITPGSFFLSFLFIYFCPKRF